VSRLARLSYHHFTVEQYVARRRLRPLDPFQHGTHRGGTCHPKRLEITRAAHDAVGFEFPQRPDDDQARGFDPCGQFGVGR
jgi:hypothetical protein